MCVCVNMVVCYFFFPSGLVLLLLALFRGRLPERSGFVQRLEIRAELTTWQLMAS